MVGAFVRWLLYSAWFSAAFVAFIYLSIPEKKLKRYVQHHAAAKLQYPVKIKGLELRGISGVTLKDVRVELTLPVESKPSPPGGPKAPASPGSKAIADDLADDSLPKLLPGYVLADEVRVDLNTLGLLTGEKLKAQIGADISGGTITNALIKLDEGVVQVDLGELTNIDLAPMRLFRALLKLNLDIYGRLSGEGRIDWRGNVADSTASIKLKVADALLPYFGLKDPKSGFLIGEMFQVELGEFEVSAKLDKAENLPGLRRRSRMNHTTLLIDKLIARGQHLELQLDGGQQHTITFVGPTTQDANVDVKFVAHFTEEFFAWKGDGVRGNGVEAKGMSHDFWKTALQLKLSRARTTIGKKTYYGFHCRGKLKTMKCEPRAPSRRIEPVAPPTATTKPEAKEVAGSSKLKRPKAPVKKASKSTSRKSAKSKRVTKRNKPAKRGLRRTRPAGKLSEPSRPDSEVKRRIARARAKTRGGMRGDMLTPAEEESGDESVDEPESDEEAEEDREEDEDSDDELDDEDDGVPEDGEPLDDETEGDPTDESEEGDEYDEEDE
jgi:type II secretion system protein N